MPYRNGTYVAFDGQGITNPTLSDLIYLGLLRGWNKRKDCDFIFSDSHLKTYQVLDTSKIDTLKNRLMERLRESKNMLLILSENTNYNRGMLNFEIENAVDRFKLPIIVAYTDCDYVLNSRAYWRRWPQALEKRILDGSAQTIHVAFKEKAIMTALKQFSVHNTQYKYPTYVYSIKDYETWGYIK